MTAQLQEDLHRVSCPICAVKVTIHSFSRGSVCARFKVENHKSRSHALSSSDRLKEFRAVKLNARSLHALSSSDRLKLGAAASLRSAASFGH